MDNITLTFTPRDLMNLAFAVSDAATSAYIDGRLCVASINHHLAARLWQQAGSSSNAARHYALARAIDREMIEAASDEEDAA